MLAWLLELLPSCLARVRAGDHLGGADEELSLSDTIAGIN